VDLLGEERFARRNAAWRDLLPTIRRYRWPVAIVFLLTVASAYAVVEFVLWERYDSRAQLLVKLGRENAEVPSTVQNSALFTSGIREQELKSIVHMLTARDVAEEVVDRLGVDTFKFDPAPPKTFIQHVKYYVKMTARWAKAQVNSLLVLVNLKKALTDRDKAILAVEGALVVGVEKDSDVIGVRAGLPGPDLAVLVNRTVLDIFFERYVRLHKGNDSLQFFEAQTEELRKALDALDEKRDRIRAGFGLSSAAEQRTLLLQRRNEAARLVDQSEGEKRALAEQQKVMQARIDALPEAQERSSVATPASPYRRSQTGSVTSELNPVREGFRRSIEEAGARIAGLDASIDKQRQVIRTLNAELARLDRGEDELNALERERKMAEANYLTYSKRREEARIRDELSQQHVANVVLMSPPSRPFEPSAPRKLLIMGIALAAGLMLGVGFALLLEYLRDSVDSARDLADLDGGAFLGSLPAAGGPAAAGRAAGQD